MNDDKKLIPSIRLLPTSASNSKKATIYPAACQWLTELYAVDNM